MKREKAQVHARQVGEQAILVIRDDAKADNAHQYRLAVIGQAFDNKRRKNDQAQRPQHGPIFANEHLVDHRLHQPGAERGGGGHDCHADDGKHDPA